MIFCVFMSGTRIQAAALQNSLCDNRWGDFCYLNSGDGHGT